MPASPAITATDHERLGTVVAIWCSPEAVGARVAAAYLDLLGRSASPGEIDCWRTTSVLTDRTDIAVTPEYARRAR